MDATAPAFGPTVDWRCVVAIVEFPFNAAQAAIAVAMRGAFRVSTDASAITLAIAATAAILARVILAVRATAGTPETAATTVAVAFARLAPFSERPGAASLARGALTATAATLALVAVAPGAGVPPIAMLAWHVAGPAVVRVVRVRVLDTFAMRAGVPRDLIFSATENLAQRGVEVDSNRELAALGKVAPYRRNGAH
jgi:hypothetical protein